MAQRKQATHREGEAGHRMPNCVVWAEGFVQWLGGSLCGDHADFGAIRDLPSRDLGCDCVPGQTPENPFPGWVFLL